ncbi:hypothetical protein ACKWTF_007620 [Chironomus riparius]
MYYTVLFKDTNAIGTVKEDWLINEQQCKYPPNKQVNKFLKSNAKCDTSKWNVYKIVLKNPKQLGQKGVATIQLSKEMERFYERFSDTEDYESTRVKQNLLKLHPTIKLQNKINFNEFVPIEVQSSAALQHTFSSELITHQIEDPEQNEDPDQNEDPEQYTTDNVNETQEENYSEQRYQIEYLEEAFPDEEAEYIRDITEVIF